MDPLLIEALGYMQKVVACSEEVKAKIAALRVPAEEVTGTRMSTSWRSGSGAAGSNRQGKGWGSGSGSGGGGSRYGFGSGSGSSSASGNRYDRTGGAGGGSRGQTIYNSAPRRPYIDRALAPRFGNKARPDVTTEERMMDRIRDKMNKFSPITYDATKTWLCQLMNSGQTGFLTDFITLVFEKAANEELHCATYAKLLTELCASFPHLATELRRIFNEFMDIFKEAATEPDVGSAEYSAFVALRERRKARRGYAAFIGQIAKLGALSSTDILTTSGIILDGLAEAKATADKGSLCEEYADCLTALMKCCRDLIKPAVEPILARVNVVKEKGGSLTNKARFALMDLVDLF